VTTPRALIAFGLAVSFLAIAATSASAATTRAEFVAQVDPICQNGQAQEAVALQPVKRATKRASKHRDSRKLRRRLSRAFGLYYEQRAAIERAVNAQIAAVPPAPDDVSLVQVWLRARGELLDLESQVLTGGVKPRKGLKGVGQIVNLFFQLIGRQQEVADLVRDFGFQYCNQTGDEFQFIG
jgi:hypothetical protein